MSECPPGYERIEEWMSSRGIVPIVLHRRISRLINFASNRYYRHDSPIMSDMSYDRFLKMLEAIESFYPELCTPDSPTQRVMD